MKTCPHRHLTTGPQNSSIHSSLKVDTAQLSIHECTLSHVRLSATLWTVARQAPLSMEFSRPEDWSGLPCPPPGSLPLPGMEPESPALQADPLPGMPVGACKLQGTSYCLAAPTGWEFSGNWSVSNFSLCSQCLAEPGTA